VPFRFLKRLWKLAAEHLEESDSPVLDAATLTTAQQELRHRIHTTINKVNDDIGRRYTFNTAIAAVMEMINALTRADNESDNDKAIMREGLETAVLLISPIVPHITDAIWAALGHKEALIDAVWPVADDKALRREEIQLVVQVNGKLRAKIVVSVDASKEQIEAIALENENIKRFIDGKKIKKVIIVPSRLVNIVIA